MSRADVAVGQGESVLALERYDAIADHGLLASHREAALWRGAHVASADLRDSLAARDRLERLLEEYPGSEHASDAWELVGHLLIGEWGRTEDAAIAFSHAHRADPDHPRAEERLIRAARIFAEIEQHDDARRHWKRLARHYPQHRALSLIGEAQVELARNDLQSALSLYEDAIPHANDPDVRGIAKLGVSGCLERLGSLDEAIAALDSTDLPATVVGPRRLGLQTRAKVKDSTKSRFER